MDSLAQRVAGRYLKAMGRPTQQQMLERAERDAHERDRTFLELVKEGMTATELRKMIKRRPALWGRYEAWLEKLPE